MSMSISPRLPLIGSVTMEEYPNDDYLCGEEERVGQLEIRIKNSDLSIWSI